MQIKIIINYHLKSSVLQRKIKNYHLYCRDLLDLDLEAEAAKQGTNEVLWAVFAAFIK
jgi:hypothetical protein